MKDLDQETIKRATNAARRTEILILAGCDRCGRRLVDTETLTVIHGAVTLYTAGWRYPKPFCAKCAKIEEFI